MSSARDLHDAELVLCDGCDAAEYAGGSEASAWRAGHPSGDFCPACARYQGTIWWTLSRPFILRALAVNSWRHRRAWALSSWLRRRFGPPR